MSLLETISLVLKHSDISTDTTLASVSNSVGSWENGKQKTTWKVNLRKLLGNKNMDENDMFVLRMNQMAYATATFPNATKDQQVIITLSGLNFINSTYNVRTGNNTNKHQMMLANISTTGSVVDYSPNVAMCNFGKSSDNVEITIELIRTIDGVAAEYDALNDKFPHCVYSFDIYAVNK